MSDPAHLLPPNASPLERALSVSIGRFDPPAHVRTLWNAATCPAAVLPSMAWALSVDEWDQHWSAEKKRAVIAASRAIHQKKGTPVAIRTALDAINQPDAEIIERSDYIRCDGSVLCDGDHTCGGEWATYRIRLLHPMTVGDAYLTKRTLNSVGRNAVHLQAIDFSAAAFRCDGVILCNGDYSCGAVDTTIN